MKLRLKHILIFSTLFFSALIYIGCAPLREFYSFPEYKGSTDFKWQKPVLDIEKKTVFLVADNRGTEIFDLLAPYYLFSATEKANVYIVAEKKYPIVIMKGLFILPHFSFRDIDSLKIKPDVIVIPNLSAMDAKHQDPVIVSWIQKQYDKTVSVLSVCDGSLTAAATGLYNGKPITTHASDYAAVKKQYREPLWVNNISVTQSERLFSTAGVSNAVEGSLTVINKIFDYETVQKLMQDIHYPHDSIKMDHKSIPLKLKNKLTVATKIFFKKNRHIGVLLQSGINEFELASVLDTYHRTFPSSIKTFTFEGQSVISKYGLTIYPTGDESDSNLDELHVLMPEKLSGNSLSAIKSAIVVKYDTATAGYFIDICLKRIGEQYGLKFQNITKLLMDYN